MVAPQPVEADAAPSPVRHTGLPATRQQVLGLLPPFGCCEYCWSGRRFAVSLLFILVGPNLRENILERKMKSPLTVIEQFNFSILQYSGRVSSLGRWI